MQDIATLTKNYQRAQMELEKARTALASALGLLSVQAQTARIGRPPGRPRTHGFTPATGSVSQAVLDFATSDPDGKTRGEILKKIPNPGAVHSALKVHKAAGRLENVDGRWKKPGKKAGKKAAAAAAG